MTRNRIGRCAIRFRPLAVHIRTIAAFVAVCSAPPRSRSRSHAALAPDAPRVAGTASPAGFTRRQDESTQTSSPGKKFRQGKSPVETPLHNYQPICKLPNRIHLSEKETINLLDETNVKTIICICKFFHTFLFPFIYFSSKCCKQKGSKGNSFRDHPPPNRRQSRMKTAGPYRSVRPGTFSRRREITPPPDLRYSCSENAIP